MGVSADFAFEVIIVEHCNMRCKYCMHFSPLASPSFVDFGEYQADMSQLSKLCHGECKEIVLVGGEPLLHPDISKILLETRRLFPIGEIKIITNGILLFKMDDTFWETCKECNVIIKVSRYPIDFPYEKIKCINHEVTIIFKDKYEMNYLPLNLLGESDYKENYVNCISADKDHCLKHGRMYTCCVAVNAEHFNEYFGQSLYLSENDSISVYEVEDIDSIISFLKHPIPFCRYCDVKSRIEDLPWEVSRCDIKEWT